MITKNKFALQVSPLFHSNNVFLKFTKLVNPPNLRLPNSLSSIIYSFVIISSKSPIPKLFLNTYSSKLVAFPNNDVMN